MVEDIPTRIIARLARVRGDISCTITRDVALSEPGRGSAEDVINGAFNIAIRIILHPRLRIERILIPLETAPVIPLFISIRRHRNSLRAFTIRIHEINIVCVEVRRFDVGGR